MDACYDPNIPTIIVNDRNTRRLVYLLLFWLTGFMIPFISRPVSYDRMHEMERKKFPEHLKYNLRSHYSSYEIYTYLEKFVHFYEHKVKMFKLSKQTYEGRDINVVHIKVPSYYGNVNKGRILVLAGMSGCIWDSVLSAIDLIHKLCEECSYKYPYSMNYEWYIIPIFNPDGYDYTLRIRNTFPLDVVNDPKNRVFLEEGQGCRGVALDRNFGFHWGESKSRDYDEYCWMGYAGKHPFSENETKAMDQFIMKQYETNQPITMYIQLHGNEYRDDVTYPWRFTKRKLPNSKTLDNMVHAATKEINDNMGYHFTYSQSGDRDASGVLSDWLMGTRRIAYAFTIEPWYQVSNESDIPDPHMYMEKAISIIFSLTKSLRSLQ